MSNDSSLTLARPNTLQIDQASINGQNVENCGSRVPDHLMTSLIIHLHSCGPYINIRGSCVTRAPPWSMCGASTDDGQRLISSCTPTWVSPQNDVFIAIINPFTIDSMVCPLPLKDGQSWGRNIGAYSPGNQTRWHLLRRPWTP